MLNLQTTEEKYKNSLPPELLVDNFYCDNQDMVKIKNKEPETKKKFKEILETAFGIESLLENLPEKLKNEAGIIGKVLGKHNIETSTPTPALSIFTFLMKKLANERQAFISGVLDIRSKIEPPKAPPKQALYVDLKGNSYQKPQNMGWQEWFKMKSREIAQQATTTLFVSDNKKTILFKWARGILLFPEKQKKGVVNLAKIIVKKFDEKIQSAVLNKSKEAKIS